MSKGFLYVWCVGYWEDGKFKVPTNLYHLKFYCENVFKFTHELSQRLPNRNWVHISERTRNELMNEDKLERMLNVCDDEITNHGQKETIFNFEVV